MDNKQLFVNGYLNRISEQFNVDKDTAFEIFSIAAITERPFQEVYDDIQIRQKSELDLQGKDGGIDGAVFVEQGGYYTLMVFQCKNSRNLKPNLLDNFRHDVDDLFIYGISKLNTELLQPKINEYQQLSKDGFIVEIKYYFIYSGTNNDPNYAANSQNYQAYHKPDEYEIWDAEAIYAKISQLIKAQASRKDIKFTFNPQTSNIITADRQGQGLYTYSVGNVRAANFRIEVDELCRLVEQELATNNTYEFLFSDNIRSFLGFKVRPNQRMKETLTDPDSAIYFPLLNNGITIICERMEIPSTLQSGKYILPAYNPIIVNGLQTTRVIYEVSKESKRKGIDLQNAFVNVRLYETSDTEIIEKITDATNTQTPISYKDKVSNKDFNLYTKEVFANKGIAYITKRGEVFSNQLSKQLKSTIENDTLLRFWYSTFYEQPETAKNSVYEVMETIFDATNNKNHPLHNLFNGKKDSPIYQQLIYVYDIYRYVQSQKELQQQAKEYISHATELLAYGIYKYWENDLTRLNNLVGLEEAYQFALNIIDRTIHDQIDLYRQKEKSFSYSGYFRKSKCRFEYNLKAGIIDDDSIVEKISKH